MTMIPGSKDFVAYQGATFKEILTITLPGPTTDISGKKFRMHVRDSISSDTIKIDLAWGDEINFVTDGTDGQVVLQVSAADTAALDLGHEKQTWIYQLEMYDDGVSPEYVDRLLTGKFTLYPESTR